MEEQKKEEKKTGKYDMPSGTADVKCPACGSDGPIKIFGDVLVELTTVDLAERLAVAEVKKWMWDNDTAAKCPKCGLLAKVFLFRNNTTAWYYMADQGVVTEVHLIKDSFITKEGGKVYALIKVADTLHLDGMSQIMVDPVELHHTRVEALDLAKEQLSVLYRVSSSLANDVTSRIGEIDLEIENETKMEAAAAQEKTDKDKQELPCE